MYKAFIVGGGWQEEKLFEKYGWQICHSIKNSDIVVFTGGEDIDPAIYGQHKHPRTYFNPMRDERELTAYKLAAQYGKKMAGICRGAQLLNALMGGSMHQDVDMHCRGPHLAFDTQTGDDMMVNSVHHQMMIPNLATGHVVLEAMESTERSRCSLKEEKFQIINNIVVLADPDEVKDVEAVAYPDAGIFCFQGHPEYCVSRHNSLNVDKIFMNYLDEIFEFHSIAA